MLFMELLILTPMFVYIRKVYAQPPSGKRQLHAWNYLWLIPLNFCMIWFLLSRDDCRSLLGRSSGVPLLLVSVMLCLGTVLVYIMVWQLLREYRQNEELREKEYMLTMQQTQYEYLQDKIEEARRAKHDLRHHIHLVSAYFNDGKTEELREYLQKYSEESLEDSQIFFCNHYATNALLVYFASQAKRFGIRYTVSVDLPVQVGIPDEALTVVLGNLLENAISACKDERQSPTIHVYGKMDESVVFFKITNTCTRLLKKDPSGQYLSTKKGEHGIGLSSVRSIVEQYEGIMETRQKDGVFTASVMLTLPEEFSEMYGI